MLRWRGLRPSRQNSQTNIPFANSIVSNERTQGHGTPIRRYAALQRRRHVQSPTVDLHGWRGIKALACCLLPSCFHVMGLNAGAACGFGRLVSACPAAACSTAHCPLRPGPGFTRVGSALTVSAASPTQHCALFPAGDVSFLTNLLTLAASGSQTCENTVKQASPCTGH